MPQSEKPRTSRRDFLKSSAALAGSLALGSGAYAAGSATLKIGLIGCGGRGTGAASNAMNAGKDVKLIALADIFEDKVLKTRKILQKAKPDQVAVDDEHCFVGFDAYQKVIDSGIDVAVIAPSSHFNSMYLKAAVDAGKHVFVEKPHSLDVAGINRVAATCEDARKKGLSVVSGLCWRYSPIVVETMKRIKDGAIGDIIAIHESYMSSPYRTVERDPQLTEMQWQFRNWYHFNWLAGDQCQQQLIHSVDKGGWVMDDEPPVQAWGVGGRSAVSGDKYGDLFDHQGVVYEYANGVRMFGFCRNQVGCHNETTDYILGSKGIANLTKGRIEGQSEWRYEGSKASMYDMEHKALFDSIRSGKPINNVKYMVNSSMLANLAQMVCHTGKRLTWEQAMSSKYSVELDRYAWDVEPPLKPNEKGEYDIAVPGVTPFV